MGIHLPQDKLIEEIASIKDAGKKVVFTNGCFDLVHAGHIRYLREAKQLGDILVVGINSDTSISRLKPHRPIISELNRAEVLAALSSVDFVALFEEDTPFNLISALRPHVVVKGGDWQPKDIVGSDIAKEVYSLRYHSGLSTSAIIESIIKKFCP